MSGPAFTKHGPCPDPLEALAALYLALSGEERHALGTLIDERHGHDSQAAFADLIRRGLRDVVNEASDRSDAAAIDDTARLLDALDLTLSKKDLRLLRRLADKQYDGDVRRTPSWVIEDALDGLDTEV